MAKRFTDTAIWDKAWFRKLKPKMKATWQYLCTRCDHAGIWPIDTDALSFNVGEDVSLSEITESFGHRVTVIESKLFISSFIEFQYGELNPNNRVHQSVISKLEKLGAYKDLTSPLQGAKDKDKEKDKDKVKEKEGGVGETTSTFENRFKFDFNALYDLYPRHEKRTVAISLMAEKIHDQVSYDAHKLAIANFKDHCERNKTEYKYILNYPNWFSEWRDWLDPNNGTSKLDKSKDEKKQAFIEELKKRGIA